jgi:hypothetical protein
MKTIRITCLAIILLFFSIHSVIAQQEQKLNLILSYHPALPVGESFKAYAGEPSFRGTQFALMYSIKPDWKLGLQLSYNDFYERFPRGVYKTSDGVDISAVLTNTMQVIPVLIKGEYQFLKDSRVRPYAGLGAGAAFINYEQFVGEFLYKQLYTRFAVGADAGVFIPFKKSAISQYGLRIGAGYHFAPLNREGISNVSMASAKIGVVIPLNK